MRTIDTNRTGLDLIDSAFRAPWTVLIAKLAVSAPFLVSGILKLTNFTGTIAEVRGLSGLEPAGLFAALVILVQLGGSFLVIAGGRWTWLGAGVLAGFTVIATLLAHAFWLKPAAEQAMHLNIFFEHVAICGGLILVAVLQSAERKT
jgi:transmembrane protein